ncbi:MAG: antibiotic biosynthesis monooxygenase [Halopseudomonas sp.]
MPLIAQTPKPPYYAVIFTNLRTDGGRVEDGYAAMAERMAELAAQQPGFLGFETAREGSSVDSLGITVSYWVDLESIKSWKANAEHLEAQRLGHEKWYSAFKTRIAKVERDYGI